MTAEAYPMLERVRIEKMAYGGYGLGHKGGKVLFVPLTVPGDTVEVRITKSKRDYDLGELIRVLSPSPHRVVPPCPYYGQCGGCQWQHIAYPVQLTLKTQQVREALERIGGIPDPPVQEMIGSPLIFAYRNKGVYHCALSRGSELAIGFIDRTKEGVIDLNHCLLQTARTNEILRELKALVKECFKSSNGRRLTPGAIRYLILRHCITTEETLALLVWGKEVWPEREYWGERLTPLREKVSILIFNFKEEEGGALLGRTYHHVWGGERLTEDLGEIRYFISPSSFFQVNTVQTKTLLRLIQDYLRLKDAEVVLDLYSGPGTIALSLASLTRQVYGVEVDRLATLDAIKSAEYNGIENCQFRTGKVERILKRLWVEGLRPGLVILDPPRGGCHPAVVEGIKRLKVPHVAYVSCNPATLARDLKLFRQMGYNVELVQPIDMFPQTYHIEVLSLLSL